MRASCGPAGVIRFVTLSLVLVVAGPGLAQPNDPAVLQDVMPMATSFDEAGGTPPAIPARRDGELIGWVFHTSQVIGSRGYSGKPLDVLVGLNLQGRITGARILEQHEPILIIGIEPAELDAFVDRYVGQDVRGRIEVVRGGSTASEVGAVSGATISSTVIGDAIVRSAREVARSRGLFGTSARIGSASGERASWHELLRDGSIQRLRLTAGEVQAALAEEGLSLYPPNAPKRPTDQLFAEVFFGLATPARVGASLLGERVYDRLLADQPAGAHLLFIGGRGAWSFKGTGWRRSGVFDRIQLIQGERTWRLQADQHVRLDELALEGEGEDDDDTEKMPELRELAVFVLLPDSGFDPAAPWRLQLLVEGAGPSAMPGYVAFDGSYRLPDRYLLGAPPDVAGGDRPLWRRIWQDRTIDIAVLTGALIVLTGIMVLQDVLVRHRRLHRGLRSVFLLFTLVWTGWYAAAQLSVLNVLTFAEALRTEFRWEMFLLEPLMFILWSYVAVALLFWGRGAFCGWLCPFGALQELTNRVGRLFRVPQLRVPFALHQRLWPIKYVIFLGLFAVSLGPTAQAVQLAEIEPFKTAIVLRFERAWPFVLYALALLGLGLFVERAFCRYLCPLGAGLAIPAKLRLFEWLERHRQCGSPCQICAVDCPVQAIHPNGRINPNECITCLHCQVNYHDSQICPPMIERRKRRERRAQIIERTGPAPAPPTG